MAASSGSSSADLEKLCAILEAVPALKYICLDVANGYSEYFVEFVKTVRGKFPKHTIMVRTPAGKDEMCCQIVSRRADAVCPSGWERGDRGDGGGAHPLRG